MKVAIVGGGIGGLTLAGFLLKGGLTPTVYEAAPEIRPLGLGVNLLPHATSVIDELGLLPEMRRRAVETWESTFFNRFGQHIWSDPAGLRAGYPVPQLSIHRGDIQQPLLDHFLAAAGPEHLKTGWRCTGFEQDGDGVTIRFVDGETGRSLPPQRADILVGAEGIHSVIRKQLHPGEGPPVYSGVNMWRGATVWPPFLQKANMVRVGWLATGKLVIYPIRNDVDGQGNQLVNWVFELETPDYRANRDWNREASLEDFWDHVKDMSFDWLDIPAMLKATGTVLEYPMVDQDPLPFWTDRRVTLLGDAAHPMYPRGSNGAGQAILDGKCLGDLLAAGGDPRQALKAYEAERLPVTARIVLMNRTNPPDAILRLVYERSGDRPFERLEDLVSEAELAEVAGAYKKVAGYDRERVAARVGG